MDSTNRIIKNTGFLYFRMIIVTLCSLITIRILLKSLGVVDYGVFNVVGGVVGALAFIQGAMTVSTQRYLSYYNGTKDEAKISRVFNASFFLHLGLGLTLLIVLLLFREYIVTNFLNLPSDRIFASNIVYVTVSISLFLTILSVPYLATLNAHENMLWISIFGIVEAILILILAVFVLLYNGDKLILYGVGMLSLNVLMLVIYVFYATKKYAECKISKIQRVDYSMIKEIAGYSGWNAFGAFTGMSKTQGLSIVFNLFYGPVVNTSYGIATQVSYKLNSFSDMMLKAVNPQIMKSEGAKKRTAMLSLSMKASKFSFYLYALFVIPFFYEIESILIIWLGKIPDYTIMFCRMIMIAVLINQMTIGLQSAIQATGKIKKYMLTVGFVKLFIIPIGYLLLKNNYSLFYVMVAYVFLEFLAGVLRIINMNYYGLSFIVFLKNVLLKQLIPFVLIVAVIPVFDFFPIQYRLFYSIPLIMILFSLFIILFGLTKNEKRKIYNLFLNLISK